MTVFVFLILLTCFVFTILIIYLVIKSHRRRPEIADKFVVGAKGKALTDIFKESGQAFVNGTIWEATTKGEPIKKGEKISVKAIDGLELVVEKRVS